MEDPRSIFGVTIVSLLHFIFKNLQEETWFVSFFKSTVRRLLERVWFSIGKR